MKGIILAGGTGSRLFPVTHTVSKQLLPVYDKPMIYYPLSVLMLAGIREILIITTPRDKSQFVDLLGDGTNFGVNITYKVQAEPRGLAEAFTIGESFIGEDSVALILGDNLFYGQGFTPVLEKATQSLEQNGRPTIFGYRVTEPQRFGVVEFDDDMKVISVEEKPLSPKSNFAITGLYFYPNDVIDKAKRVMPSQRCELEITSINKMYMDEQRLDVQLLGRGFAWLDTGTHDSLIEASQFIHTIERQQGLKIACLEEIAYQNEWICLQDLKNAALAMEKSDYGQYLKRLVE